MKMQKEDCLNEDMMYCALELGNYSSALDYICNEIKLGMADKDELKVLKRLRKMLKHQKFEDIQDVLKRNKSLWKKEFDDRMMKF